MARIRRLPWVTGAVVLVVALLAGCGSSDSDPSGTATTDTSAGAAAPGPVEVMAAASLTNVFEDGAKALEADDSAWDVAPLAFAGSQDLVRQLQEGDDADVVALADRKNMRALEDDGLVEKPMIFATNKLVIAVQPGNPKGIETLADLADPGLKVVLADPSVPAGRYAAFVLDNARVRVRPKSLELDVRSTLAKVSERTADAAIVYRTDVKAKDDEVDGVEIPDDQNVVAPYPVAVLKAAKHPAAARAFVESLRSGTLHDLLQQAGFGAP